MGFIYFYQIRIILLTVNNLFVHKCIQVFCLSWFNNNAVGARCCWGGSPYRSCKVRIRASQSATVGVTRDIHGYERAHLSSHYPDDPSSMAAKRGHWERLTYESLKCSTTIAFVTFNDVAKLMGCSQLLYNVTWTSILFHPSCSSAVSDGSGTQLDAQRERSSAMYFSPLHFPNWRKRVGGQLKTWASTIKDDLAALSGLQVVGLRRWNRDWLAISCDMAQGQRTLAAMVRDAELTREEAGSTWTGWKPPQVKSSIQVLQCITNNSIKHKSFVYHELADQTVLFQAIQFSINYLFGLS